MQSKAEMAGREIAKIISIVAGIAALCIHVAGSLFSQYDWHTVGIYSGCPLPGRMLYPFFHANWLHVCLNVWCLWSIVFLYDIRAGRLLAAYLVATTFPAGLFCKWNEPTVGLSGVIFFLFGRLSFEVLRKWYWQAWMSGYLLLGFCFPNTNAWLHLYCYVIGLLIAFLNRPIKIAH